MRLNDPGPHDEQNFESIPTITLQGNRVWSYVRSKKVLTNFSLDNSDEEWSESDEDGEDIQNDYQALPQDAPVDVEEQQGLVTTNHENTDYL